LLAQEKSQRKRHCHARRRHTRHFAIVGLPLITLPAELRRRGVIAR
jgi:hypothetical protein